MSERGGRGGARGGHNGVSSSRGGASGGGRGGGGSAGHSFRGSGRGGSRNNNTNNNSSHQSERPKKEAILDLTKYIDQNIRVKFAGGREVFGTLKGFDQLMNLVMDQVVESLRDEEGNVSDKTRNLGLVVLRGTALTVINPADGFESIEK
uniref:Related to snRNP protein n=1 Tax=Melanopsichium pennsylvanicum 4 TaxID=1398559 RepID=A0A077RAZ3_9BASI|nr:related to snRNP protein [Melanopsichium pennsylvanicum 4]